MCQGRRGLPFLHNNPAAPLKDAKAKGKKVKRKGPSLLAAEPKQKHGHDYDEPEGSSCLFCTYHNVHTHNTNDCQELRELRDERLGCRLDHSDRGASRGGGRYGG